RGRPEDAVAESVRGGSPKVRSGSASNAMAWRARPILNVCETSDAGRYVASPACDAVMVQTSAWRSVTVPSATEHAPLAANVTGADDLVAQRVVTREEPRLGRRATRPRDERRSAAVVQAVARGQVREDRILAAREQNVDAAAAGREQGWDTTVAQHEPVIVDDRRVAGESRAWVGGPFIRQRTTRAGVDV